MYTPGHLYTPGEGGEGGTYRPPGAEHGGTGETAGERGRGSGRVGSSWKICRTPRTTPRPAPPHPGPRSATRSQASAREKQGKGKATCHARAKQSKSIAKKQKKSFGAKTTTRPNSKQQNQFWHKLTQETIQKHSGVFKKVCGLPYRICVRSKFSRCF